MFYSKNKHAVFFYRSLDWCGHLSLIQVKFHLFKIYMLLKPVKVISMSIKLRHVDYWFIILFENFVKWIFELKFLIMLIEFVIMKLCYFIQKTETGFEVFIKFLSYIKILIL